MGLPTQIYPLFTTTVPTTKQTITFRPFIVSEQKSLLIADETEDFETMVKTVKEVLKNTIQDDIDVDALSSVDIEYLFTQIRAKSVGEIVELKFGCDEEACTDYKNSFVIIPIDLTTIEVEFSKDYNETIQLSENLWMKMKLPTIDVSKYIVNSDDQDAEIKIIANCIDIVYSKDETWNLQDSTNEELVTFIKNLTPKQFNDVEKFFYTLPSLTKKITWECPVCKKQHEKTIRGLKNFFL